MEKKPLPRTLRLRVTMVSVCAALLVLLSVPLWLGALTQDPVDTYGVALASVVGIVIPGAFGAVMWWQARRWRRDPEVRRRELSGPTQRLLLFGNLAVLFVAQAVRGLSGLSFWPGLALGFVVAVVGAVLVWLVAKRRDPRLHLFRRADPLPERQEADDVARAPW